MTKTIATGALALLLTGSLPCTAAAAGIIFEPSKAGQAAAWKPANLTPANGKGGGGFWDQRSYDSASKSAAGQCNVGTIVNGMPCDWAGTTPATPITATNTADPTQLLEYFGLTSGEAYDAPLNFYFEAGFLFDWEVLYQLTDWSEDVEFGWYAVSDPTNLNPIVSPKGPFAPPERVGNEVGMAIIPSEPFGLYYRNTRYTATGEKAPGDGSHPEPFTFYTQSRLNAMGSYTGYFRYDLTSGLHGPNPYDDEAKLIEEIVSPSLFQQFALFRQGKTYWIGLEDQLGQLNGSFCSDRIAQPCSDYDFNDFIMAMTERNDPPPPPPVPEPASLTLLASGLFGLAWLRRRVR